MKFEKPLTNWIWGPGWEEKDQAYLTYFRKSFELESIPEHSKIIISADTRYKLYVNGQLAEIGPSKGNGLVWYCDEVNLVPYLTIGKNTLAVEVLRYPLGHQKGNQGMFRTEKAGLFVLEEPLTETEREAIAGTPLYNAIAKKDRVTSQKIGLSADSTWKCELVKDFQIILESDFFAPLQILENRRGRREYAEWRMPGYDDSEWVQAVPYDYFQISKAISPGNLTPRTIPYMRKDEHKFVGVYGNRESSTSGQAWDKMLCGNGKVQIPANTHEYVEMNAGELMTGYLSLRMVDGEGAVIKILTSEGYVQKKNDVDSNNNYYTNLPEKKDRCDFVNGYLHGFTDTYQVDGFGTEEQTEDYEPFWFRTFRFIRLDIKTGSKPLIIEGFDYRETGYPLESKTWVETSDSSLGPIWDISLRTLKRCMHETYEDCPFYEQLQYAMDSRSQILYTYMVSADDRLARKCMEDFRCSVRDDGMINCSFPCYEPNIIPGFSIYYIMMLYDHMMYFGDKEFLRMHMSVVDGILEFFNRHLDERGLVGNVGGLNIRTKYWSFIDWTAQWDATSGMPPAGVTGPITMESLLYIMGLMHAAKIAEYLGRNGIAEEYLNRAKAVRDAVNTYCTDKDGMYLDGPGVKEYSQHCQVFAILTDTVAVSKGRLFLKKTIDDTTSYVQCSVAMAYYLFRAMEKTGLYDKTDEKWNLWRDMVKNNLTTCVEDNVNERSDCHAWGALALYELPAVILGVSPEAPGFSKIKIVPNPGYLSWAKGEVATKWGMIKVSWQKDSSGKVSVDYQAPKDAPIIVINR